jgi:hypothetical protein
MAFYLKKTFSPTVYIDDTSISPKAEALVKTVMPAPRVEAVLWNCTEESFEQIKAMVGEKGEVSSAAVDLLAIRIATDPNPRFIFPGFFAVKYRPDLIAGCRPDIFQSTYQRIEE